MGDFPRKAGDFSKKAGAFHQKAVASPHKKVAFPIEAITFQQKAVAFQSKARDWRKKAAAYAQKARAKGAMSNAYQERDEMLDTYDEILSRIRAWLISKLNDRDRDERLQSYGFNPKDELQYKTPAQVTNLSGVWVPDESLIKLTWNAAENAKDYEVYIADKPANHDEDPNFSRIAKTDHLFRHITDVDSGKTYLFKVRGVTHFRQGDFSEIVQVEVP